MIPSFRLFLLVTVFGTFTCESLAQHKLNVLFDSDTGEQRRVWDYHKGNNSYVEIDGRLKAVQRNYYYLQNDYEYALGYLEVNQPRATVVDYDGYQEFDFRVMARADRDFKQCFAVVHLKTLDGASLFVPSPIGDIKAGKARDISMRVPLGVKVRRGAFEAYLFSEGREIYQAPTEVPLNKKKGGQIESRSRGSLNPALVAGPRLLAGPPVGLVTQVANETAVVSLIVTDHGYSIDHKVVEASNEVAGQWAANLLKTARFEPGAEDGVYVPKPLKFRLSFDHRGTSTITVE